jgi:hypothetical protein
VKEKKESLQLFWEAQECHQLRKKPHSKNQNDLDSQPEGSFFNCLDSSLKTNTAFVRKVKTI